MLKRLNYKCGQIFLQSKIFSCIVPLHLYGKVFWNTSKNFLHLYRPSSAILGLTYRCQCKCVHCSAGLYRKDIENELTTEEWFTLLDAISRLGVPRINLSGGEALLRNDIFEIIEYAVKKFVVILESNGQLLTENTVNSLKKTKISCVSVSIDSWDASTHDKLRNLNGCFKNAVQGVSNLIKNKIPCILSTYVTSERVKYDNIANLMSLAERLGVLAVRVMPPRPVGSFSCFVDSLLHADEENQVMKFINPYRAYFKGIPAPHQCGIFNKATFYVSPYGDIQPCPFMPLSFGNIKDDLLSKLLMKMWHHDIFKVEYRDCLILNNDFRQKRIQINSHSNPDLPLRV